MGCKLLALADIYPGLFQIQLFFVRRLSLSPIIDRS